ncbi:MAG TPA: NADH-quinone oxidoreductase subunit L [Vicinamibacterales bacterium]|nr:NADH-quinone oxidoreductase subunit L [Vicinamibacterales bacterium]
MLVLVPLLPFAGFLINASLGRRISKRASGLIACGALVVSFAISLVEVLRLVGLPPESRSIVTPVFTWIASGDLTAPLSVRLDPLSAVMILVVTGIGALIHVYSTAYMHEESDPEYARYFSYLNLFAAFMLLLVLGSNFLVMFVGWEGVGLCSYLLIGFWYDKLSAANAGKKAFIVNRVGDFGFLLGLLLTFVRFGTLDFHEISRSLAAIGPETSFGTLSAITLLLFIGATGKSAQLPLYVWLPDAMEGPTPVSALIHAATMVTSGVYMIARNGVLFGHAPQTLAIIAVVGAATAFMAATIGLVQTDIKRVLAYSTISQLGYMFLAMGVGAYAAGIFHLYTHAFFKALLFLGSGAVIHALAGEQDLRRMGGLRRELPVTYWTFLLGTLAIAGVPGLAGFFSKDEILYRTFATGHTFLWAIGLTTSLMTAVYMFRIVFLAFHGERAAAPAAHHNHLHDAPPAMAFALIVLAVGSVAAGWVGLGGRFEHFLEPAVSTPAVELATTAGLETSLMIVSSVVAFVGIGIAALLFLRSRQTADEIANRFSGLYRLLLHKYYVDEIYDATIVQPIRMLSEEGLWKIVDVRVIDGTVNRVGNLVAGSAEVVRRTQTGSVRAYAASFLLGAVLIVGYYLWR